MKIVINTSHQRFGGAVQVALSFINECRNFSANEYHIFVGPGVRKLLDEKNFPSNFIFYYFDYGKINIFKTILINYELKKLEKIINPDCIFSTSGPTYFNSIAPQIIGFNLPLYIYPESPYVKNLSILSKLKLKIKKNIHLYYYKRDANAFVVQTDDVNSRVKKELNTEKVYTVTNTVNGFYSNWKPYKNKLPLRQNSEIRLITLSSYYFHKNLEIIPRVSDILKSRSKYNIKFVLTLKKKEFIQKINYRRDENIINVGSVKPEECPSLYNECDIMFLPTLAECFSASYPEAMIMKKPIITTDLGFAKSICGDAAIYFEPLNPSDAANKIEELINNKSLQNALVEKGIKQLKNFDTAYSRAKKYLDLCNKLIADSK